MAEMYDVIIIGAGPAGATLAYELARSAIKVLIIEKEVLPRYKCCGGGLTNKTEKLLESLGLDINNVIEDTISSATIQYGDKHREFTESIPLMYTVSREHFDHALVKKAETAGSEILPGMKVLEARNRDGWVEINTEAGIFRSRFMAGADGAAGITNLAINSVNHGSRIIGIESEIQVSEADKNQWKSRILLDLGRIKAGYAWVFPKNDYLSVGIGCMERYAKDIKNRYQDFLESLDLSGYTVKHIQGSVIPIHRGKEALNKGRILLLGDAAGLADPLTGEGIYNAVKSATIAAIVLKKSLSCDGCDLSEYTRLVEEKLMPEIRTAKTFSKVLTLVPQRLFSMLEKDDRVWLGCRRMLCGELRYTDIMSRLSSLGGMYSFVFRR